MKQVLQEQVEDDTIGLPEYIEEYLGLCPWERIFDDSGEWQGGYRRHPKIEHEGG